MAVTPRAAPPQRAARALAVALAALATTGAPLATAAAAPPPGAPAAPDHSGVAGHALAPASPGAALAAAGAAAQAADWPQVVAIVEPLLAAGALTTGDRAEAHRLSGLAAFYQERRAVAEAHFLALLRLDLDARLDLAIHPPDVVGFFEAVRTRHAAELRARRPRVRRSWLLSLVPPGGQLQNGARTKAWVVGGALGGLAAANLGTYLLLRSWCTRVSGAGGSSVTCDGPADRARAARAVRGVNLATGVGLVAVYAYGVYDGITSAPRRTGDAARAYLAPISGGAVVGITGAY